MGAGAKLLIISIWSAIDPRLLQEEFTVTKMNTAIKQTNTLCNIKSALVSSLVLQGVCHAPVKKYDDFQLEITCSEYNVWAKNY